MTKIPRDVRKGARRRGRVDGVNGVDEVDGACGLPAFRLCSLLPLLFIHPSAFLTLFSPHHPIIPRIHSAVTASTTLLTSGMARTSSACE